MTGSGTDRLAQLKRLAEKSWEVIQTLREDFRAKTKFQQLRILIAGLFVLDVALTITFAAARSGPSADIEAWYQKSFPLDMLIVRNLSGDELYDLSLVLDGRYRATVSHVGEAETMGLEIENRFLADDGFGPGRGYVPKLLSVDVDGEHIEIPLKVEK